MDAIGSLVAPGQHAILADPNATEVEKAEAQRVIATLETGVIRFDADHQRAILSDPDCSEADKAHARHMLSLATIDPSLVGSDQ